VQNLDAFSGNRRSAPLILDLRGPVNLLRHFFYHAENLRDSPLKPPAPGSNVFPVTRDLWGLQRPGASGQPVFIYCSHAVNFPANQFKDKKLAAVATLARPARAMPVLESSNAGRMSASICSAPHSA
jgi:hypothetical protein